MEKMTTPAWKRAMQFAIAILTLLGLIYYFNK